MVEGMLESTWVKYVVPEVNVIPDTAGAVATSVPFRKSGKLYEAFIDPAVDTSRSAEGGRSKVKYIEMWQAIEQKLALLGTEIAYILKDGVQIDLLRASVEHKLNEVHKVIYFSSIWKGLKSLFFWHPNIIYWAVGTQKMTLSSTRE